jgi:NADH:ubiquinone oxidoreductase subunit
VLKWLRANTLGTYLLTRWKGDPVGEDAFGNRYYRVKGAQDWRSERRWVVYADGVDVDGSLVPPGWHAWLNHSRERPPSEEPLPVKRWEKEHRPNLTGSPEAYVPPGHERRGGQRDRATGDYEAWRP